VCVLTLDPSDPTDVTFLVAPAGQVTVKILGISGSVTFAATSNVIDSSGAVVPGTAISPDGLSFNFSTKAGNEYTLNANYKRPILLGG